MSAIQYVLGIVLIILAIVLIVSVLLQESRSAGLSGAISGGADTFFGKTKGKTIEQKLAKITKTLLHSHYKIPSYYTTIFSEFQQ